MCNQQTQNVIEDVVNGKVNAGELFTAFDVTLAIQDRLKADGSFDANQHRHRHLKNDIHTVVESYVASRQYSRNLQDVGAPTNAFVYFPVGGDPSAYVPVPRKDTPAASADPHVISIPGGPSVAADNDGDGVDTGRTPDARGTVCVSSFLLRAAGFQHNDTAYISASVDGQNRNQLVITKTAPAAPAAPITTYTVDYHGNVRITKSTFDYAGLRSGSYDFEGDSTQVVVREHV